MAKVYTYPHWEISVIDRSIYTPLDAEILPLFRPIFFMRAQQGPVGVPVWCESYTRAAAIFGEGTFDNATDYYSRESLYLSSLFARQGAFIVRMADSTAAKGSLVLELTVKSVKVRQYETDADGQFVLDENGNKIPLVDDDEAYVEEDGLEFKWTTRQLAEGETVKGLKPVTIGTGASAKTVYPILAVEAGSVGAYAKICR